jgi:ComF family protein
MLSFALSSLRSEIGNRSWKNGKGANFAVKWIDRAKRSFSKAAGRGIDLAYPPQCGYCAEELPEPDRTVELCRDCQRRAIPMVWTFCERCGGYVEGKAGFRERCPSCSGTRLSFDAAVALGDYHAQLQPFISRMKHPKGESVSIALGKLLAMHRWETLDRFASDVIVPIPMHWMHRFWRQMNSPDAIARVLGSRLGIPVRRFCLFRCKKTETQSELPPAERIRNVRGAFRVRFHRLIRGRRVLLVDDVLTTGATCSEAAKVLKQAGAAHVAVAVIARTHGER